MAAAAQSLLLNPSEPGRGWFKAFRDFSREHGFEPLRVQGTIPEDLAGTLYRNGPSLFSNFGHRYGHWFDGDGAITAARISSAGAEGAVRLVQSKGLLEERRAGRALYNNYGTRSPGLVDRFRRGGKNTANTSVIVWQNRLFALQEGSKPTELSRETLETLSETDLDSVVTRTFSAHPHHVRERKAAYNFGVRYGRVTELDLFALPDVGPARRLARLPLAGATMIHDFITTPNHLIFFAPPLRLRLFRLLLGLETYSESLAWRPEEGTEVLVVPIDRPTEPRRFTVEAFYQWHFSNAFERDGELVVDFVRYPDFDTNRWLRDLTTGDPASEAKGRFGRAVIDPKAGSLRYKERWDLSCEFPRVASCALGKNYRWSYLASHQSNTASTLGLPTQLSKLDVESGTAQSAELGPEQYPSEPLFVARRGAEAEDDGYLLTLVYDALSDKSHVAIVDAHDVTRPPLARLHFDHAIPLGFHGFWQSAAAGV